MKILDIKIMRGPNYWSNYRKKLIVMKLDLGRYEELPTNVIDGFNERLKDLIPSLYEHRCSEESKGGFFKRLEEGTWLGHVIEHVALEMQTLAGMDCGFGRTRSTGKYGVYKVVFSYQLEKAGVYAGEEAVNLVQSLAENKEYDLTAALEKLKSIHEREAAGPSTQAILDEAARRNIPITRLDDHSLYMLGYGSSQQHFRATVLGTTSNIGVESAGCKWQTKKILGAAGISVPKGRIISDKTELEEALSEMSFPFVVKPVDGNHGRGITTNIKCPMGAIRAAEEAWKISDEIIMEEFIEGPDYRFLVINYKLVAVARRNPASVTGDGVSTISELVERTNMEPNRGERHEKVLTTIKIDNHSLDLLREQGLTLDSVPFTGMEVLLKRTANLSTGGTSIDVTDDLHPYNVFLAERVARLLQLDVCGIDIVARDVTQPIKNGNGAIIEVNAGPGFRMHTHPSEGTPRDVAKPVVDLLFPENANGRIPLVAVTGTNGKTTTTRLIAHIAKHAGKTAGYTTTEGIYINEFMIEEGDCSGPQSAKMILSDPTVDYAVLECARGGILRSGLGFDECSISVVTNVSEDHLGIDDIDTMDDYARVKEVVARSTSGDGYAILNADDDLVFDMRKAVSGKIVLFSLDGENSRIAAHCADGGLAVTVEEGFFVVKDGLKTVKILGVHQVPVTLGGKASFMIANVLPSIAAGIVSGFSTEAIRAGLLSFIPSAEMTPGRMNSFGFAHCTLMIDYAHNASGFEAIKQYMATVEASLKIGVIGATGDRRDEDILNQGRYAAEIFDEVIIRHDTDGRGRTNKEMTRLLIEGISKVNPNMHVKVISDEASAIESAVANVPEGGFVFVCADHVKRTIGLVQKLQEKRSYAVSQAS